MTKKELDHQRYLAIKSTSEYRKRNSRSTRTWKLAHPERAYPGRIHRDPNRIRPISNPRIPRGPRVPHNPAEYRVRIKLEVLSHYGPNGMLQCSWPDCEITDIDMLSLDHVNNDGASERKNGYRGGGGIATYQRVRRDGFPEGYQTLCHNHQWKKELMRRREQRGDFAVTASL